MSLAALTITAMIGRFNPTEELISLNDDPEELEILIPESEPVEEYFLDAEIDPALLQNPPEPRKKGLPWSTMIPIGVLTAVIIHGAFFLPEGSNLSWINWIIGIGMFIWLIPPDWNYSGLD